MKCLEVQHWLFAVRPDAELPCALRQHLMRCLECRLQQQALARLDHQVQQLPMPPASAGAREKLWQRIDSQSALARASLPPLPNGTPTPPTPLAWRRLRWRYAAVAAAAAVLFAFGLLLGRQSAPPQPDQLVLKPGAEQSDGAAQLVVQVARHDVQLASAGDEHQRLDVLNQLAADLKEEALRLARKGTLDDVPLLAGLYEQVAYQGVVRRTLLLPADQRPVAAAAAVKHFQSTSAEIESFAKTALPVVADMLQPLAQAARQSAGMLTAAEPPAPPALGPPLASTTDAPLSALVHLTLKLADTADPLQRANVSSEVASALAQSTVVLSAAGATQQADQLGLCLGDLLEHGVAGNLAKLPLKDDKVLQAEVDRVWSNSAHVFVVLENNLAQASPLAQEGLKKALQSSSHGRDTVLKQSKGAASLPDEPRPNKNGPGKSKTHLPPGLNKEPGKSKSDTEEVKGVLKSVDPIQQTLTIAVKKKGKLEDHTYGLLKSTQVIGNSPGKAGSLAPGVEVHLTLSEDRKTVVEIRVAGKK